MLSYYIFNLISLTVVHILTKLPLYITRHTFHIRGPLGDILCEIQNGVNSTDLPRCNAIQISEFIDFIPRLIF
jgi:hypothetical protein